MQTLKEYKKGIKTARLVENNGNYTIYCFYNNGETISRLYSGKNYKTITGAERGIKKFLNF